MTPNRTAGDDYVMEMGDQEEALCTCQSTGGKASSTPVMPAEDECHHETDSPRTGP